MPESEPGRDIVVLLFMPFPSRFWMAGKSDFPRLVDPDIADQRQRHSDRDDLDWASVARVAHENGTRIVQGDVYIDDDGDQVFELKLDGLPALEAKIVQSWFPRMIEAPRGDPGDTVPANGRHRLWNCWVAEPTLSLPVHSELLGYEDSVESEPRLRSTMTTEACRILSSSSVNRHAEAPRYWERVRYWVERAGAESE